MPITEVRRLFTENVITTFLVELIKTPVLRPVAKSQ